MVVVEVVVVVVVVVRVAGSSNKRWAKPKGTAKVMAIVFVLVSDVTRWVESIFFARNMGPDCRCPTSRLAPGPGGAN